MIIVTNYDDSPFTPPPGYLLDEYPGAALCYSALKLSSLENASVIASNSSLVEETIGFSGDVIDGTQLENLAGGGLVTTKALVDQANNFGNLVQSNKDNQSDVTDGSGVSLGYISTNQATTLYKGFIDNATPRPNLTGDIIFSFVFKNNTSSSTDSAIFSMLDNNSKGLSINIRRGGSNNYAIDFLRDSTLGATGSIGINRDLEDWVLLTITSIGGVHTVYVDTIVVPYSNPGSNTVDARYAGTFKVTVRQVSVNSQIRKIDYKTIVMYTGADLSSFDVDGFNSLMAQIHNIS